MSKKITISLIIGIVLSLISTLVIFLVLKNNYDPKISKAISNQTETQEKTEALRNVKDANGFTPTYVVKYYINALKEDEIDKAKLYLSKEGLKNEDLLPDSGGISFIDKIEFSGYEEKIEGDKATVKVNETFEGTTMSIPVNFILTREDSTWKLEGVKA